MPATNMIRHLLLASLSLVLLQSLHAAPAAVSFTQSATTVDAFDFVEVSVNVTQPDAANPFTDVPVTGEFARQGGSPLKADGFCDATDGTHYTLTVREVQDQSSPPNRLTEPARVVFDVHDASRPIVELRFNEGRGESTANTGTSAQAHPNAAFTDKQLTWTTSTPPGGGPSAVDLGSAPANRAVELRGDVVSALKGLKSFTLSGWGNCRSTQVGSGGNRIVTAIHHGGDGFDLVMLADGRLQLGVNEWPDGGRVCQTAPAVINLIYNMAR